MKKGIFAQFEGLTCSGKSTHAMLTWQYVSKQGIACVYQAEPSQRIFGKVIREYIEHKHIGFDSASNHRFMAAVGAILLRIKSFPRMNSEENKELLQKFNKEILSACELLKVGKKISEEQMQYLYLLDRAADVADSILPLLKNGTWVVQDRFDFSTFAYGGSVGLKVEDLYAMHQAVLGYLYEEATPDLFFYIDVLPEMAFERLQKSGKEMDRFEKLEIMRNTKSIYERMINYAREVGRFQTKSSSVSSGSAGMYYSDVKPLYDKPATKILLIDGNKPLEEVFKDISSMVQQYIPSQFSQ